MARYVHSLLNFWLECCSLFGLPHSFLKSRGAFDSHSALKFCLADFASLFLGEQGAKRAQLQMFDGYMSAAVYRNAFKYIAKTYFTQPVSTQATRRAMPGLL